MQQVPSKETQLQDTPTNHFTKAVVALLLLVPIPSLSVAIGMGVLIPPGPVAKGIFIAAKIWLLAFPLVWLILVDKQRPCIPAVKKPGLLIGLIIGLLSVGVIFTVYFWLGSSWIDPQMVRDAASKSGLDQPRVYIIGAVYFCLVNSLLEEYVWRWFVFRKSEVVLTKVLGSGGKYAAVFASALFFTLHHIVALRVQFHWDVTILASLGVFIGGAIWSGFYLKYRSIWPGYVAHVLADIPIFIIGWWLIFGN